jgi:hypothetical protein
VERLDVPRDGHVPLLEPGHTRGPAAGLFRASDPGLPASGHDRLRRPSWSRGIVCSDSGPHRNN